MYILNDNKMDLNCTKKIVIANISVTLLFCISFLLMYIYYTPKNGNEEIELLRDVFLFHYNRELQLNKTCNTSFPL